MTSGSSTVTSARSVTAKMTAVAGLTGLTALLAACSGAGAKTSASTVEPATTPSTAATTAPAPSTAAAAPTCPLTGTAPPAGGVPQRPALAVKVENLPAARPQYGIDAADIVYEEPVEGGITRFIAIFQCHDAARIEPIRSGRIIDPELIMQYGAHPLISYAGAIDAAVAAIHSSPLLDLSAASAPASVYPRDPARQIPHNLMSSTSTLYAYADKLYGNQTVPPAPVFTYGPVPSTGTDPAASVHIGYEYSDLTWTYNASNSSWSRSYSDTGAANLGDGGQIVASNIVVMHVNEYPSQYVEDPTGAHENLLTLTGTGPLQVYRGGVEISGSWSRPTLSAPTQYLNAAGQTIPMQPGQTWIELVPQTVAVNTTP